MSKEREPPIMMAIMQCMVDHYHHQGAPRKRAFATASGSVFCFFFENF
jgi:hypothetical protein